MTADAKPYSDEDLARFGKGRMEDYTLAVPRLLATVAALKSELATVRGERDALRAEAKRFVSALADYEFKCGGDHVGVFDIVDEFEARSAIPAAPSCPTCHGRGVVNGSGYAPDPCPACSAHAKPRECEGMAGTSWLVCGEGGNYCAACRGVK